MNGSIGGLSGVLSNAGSLLEKSVEDISLDWGDDPASTLVIFRDVQPHAVNLKLRAAFEAGSQ